ncbi:unnamed protein product [Closterium sp. NIES-64]|nr:unnamed protein product [Closterium sp. NIES-64]
MNQISEYPPKKFGHRRVASDSLQGFCFGSGGSGAGSDAILSDDMDVVAAAAGKGVHMGSAMEHALFADMVDMGGLGGTASLANPSAAAAAGGAAGGGTSYQAGHHRADSAGSGGAASSSGGAGAVGGSAGGGGGVAGGGSWASGSHGSGYGAQGGGQTGAVGGYHGGHAGHTAGARGAPGGSGGGGGHSRSFSVDDAFMFKAGPIRDSLSPICSPLNGSSPLRRGGRRADGGLSIKDEVDELDDEDAVRRVMATKKTAADNEVIDAKKAKRILANRLSAARSKERKTRYIMELEEKLAAYEKQAHALKATLSILQRETTSLAEANDGMTKKLQLLEQLYQQSEVENKHLHDQVEMLRTAAGLPPLSQFPNTAAASNSLALATAAAGAQGPPSPLSPHQPAASLDAVLAMS